jgi:hypothetical protein
MEALTERTFKPGLDTEIAIPGHSRSFPPAPLLRRKTDPIRDAVANEKIREGRDGGIGNDLGQCADLIFLRTVPTSRKANPARIARTMIPPSNTNSTSPPVFMYSLPCLRFDRTSQGKPHPKAKTV